MTRALLLLLISATIASSAMLAGCSSSTSPGSGSGSNGGGLFIPDTINFGSLASGQTRDTVISIFNETGAAITITGNSLSSPQASDTNFSHPVSIAPGYITIHIEFTSSGSGTNSAMDSIRYQSAGKSYVTVMMLEANGSGSTGNSGSLFVSPPSIDFGSLPVGQWHDTTVFLINTSSTALTITSSSISSSEAQDTNFSLPVTINGGGNATIHVQFNPSQTGFSTAVDSIHYRAGGTIHTATITMTATGSAAVSSSPGPGSTFTFVFTSVDTNGIASPPSDSTYTIVSNSLSYHGKTNVLEVRDGSGGLSYYHVESNGDISTFIDFSSLAGIAAVSSQWLVIPIASKTELSNTLFDTTITDPTGQTNTPVTITLATDGKDLGAMNVNAAAHNFSCENGSLTITISGTATVFGFPVQVFSQATAVTISYSKQLGYYPQRKDLYTSSSLNTSTFQQQTTTSSDAYLLKSYTVK